MDNTTVGIVAILAGIAQIIYRKQIVSAIFKQQKELFGLNFSDKIKKLDVKFSIVIGVLFIISGLLFILGVFGSQ